jgi:hypothetical protein
MAMKEDPEAAVVESKDGSFALNGVLAGGCRV